MPKHTFVKTTFSKPNIFSRYQSLGLSSDRSCSHQMLRMHGTSEERGGAVFALQPERTLPVRWPRGSNPRPALETFYALAERPR